MADLIDALLSFVSGLLIGFGVLGFVAMIATFVWLFWPRKNKS